jgi:mediator of RNA polymerase II transcription subunit 12
MASTFLQRICLAYPDAFVSPRTWTTHSSLLEEILTRDLAKNVADQHLEQNIREIQRTLQDDFINIKARNEIMSFSTLPTQQTGRLWDAVSDIQVFPTINTF